MSRIEIWICIVFGIVFGWGINNGFSSDRFEMVWVSIWSSGLTLFTHWLLNGGMDWLIDIVRKK